MQFILRILKKWEVPVEDKEEFFKTIDKINISRGKYTSFMFVFMLLALLICSYIGNETGIYRTKEYVGYMGMYAFMMFFMLLAFHALLFAERKLQKPHRSIWILGDMMILMILLWSAGISLMDQKTSGQIIVFMITVICMAFTQIIPPIHFFATLALAEIVFSISLPFYQHNSTTAFLNMINSFGFICIAWAVSCMRYKKQMEDFQLRKLLQTKNEELLRTNKELEYLSKIDGMTGIYNRQAFDRILEESLKRCKLQEQQLTLLMLDIDDFKGINDNYGHQTGDNCINRLGSVLNEVMQKWNCICARYGGDEFIVILESYSMEKVQQIMREIEERLSVLSIYVLEQNCRISIIASMGVFTKIPDKETGLEFVSQVDMSLYAEKRRKKGNITNNIHN